MTDLLLTLAHVAVFAAVLVLVLAVIAFIGGMCRIGTGDGEGGE